LRLTWDDQEHGEPRWSPDGRWLVFRRDGDLWAMAAPDLANEPLPATPPPLPRLSVSLTAPTWAAGIAPEAQQRPPATIRVIHRAENTYRANVPPGRIDVIDFETYVRQVVPYEMPASWNPEALRAQAVAARTYAWQRVLTRQSQPWDVSDWTDTQVMGANTYPATNQAVDDTRGQYVAYGGAVISAMYSAQNGSPTLTASWGTPYLQSVDDPVCFGEERWGHGLGLSQVGAHRWGAWHAWDYQQILRHYYTNVTVERPAGDPPDATPPLVQIVAPWPGFYLRSGYAWLQANASDDSSGVVTVEFYARYHDGAGWQERFLGQDVDGGDGWSWLWDLRTVPEHGLVSQPLEVRAVARDRAGNVGQAVVPVRYGLDRSAPLGSASVTTPVVVGAQAPVQVHGADVGPAGLAGVALSSNWIWQGEALLHQGGSGAAVADPSALNGAAWCAAAGVHQAGGWYGPYTFALMPGRPYQAHFRLRTDDIANPARLAVLDVVDQAGARLLGLRHLQGTDFVASGAYQEFTVQFHYAEGDRDGVEFRVWYSGAGSLCLDRVQVTTMPQAVDGGQIPWTLWGGEGGRQGQARLIDQAGNLGPDLPLAAMVLDDAPPTGWSDFQPTGWISTTAAPAVSVGVQDPLSGLDAASAGYGVQVDGVGEWGPWQLLSLTPLPNPAWPHRLTVAALALPGDGLHLVRFRIADRGARQGTSPEYVVRVDRTPPQTSATAPPASAQREFVVRWGGADNLSGLVDYSVQVREGPSGSWTTWIANSAATQATFQGEWGSTYYFRSRGRDVAGNVEPYPDAPDGDASTYVGAAATTATPTATATLTPLPTPTPTATSAPWRVRWVVHGVFADLNGNGVADGSDYLLDDARFRLVDEWEEDVAPPHGGASWDVAVELAAGHPYTLTITRPGLHPYWETLTLPPGAGERTVHTPPVAMRPLPARLHLPLAALNGLP
ncbi:MAG: SpoIID/LytB domain-containing protein, partial [Chloroflexi bacterium]|nr:SpoIID/LytB domain-containing protein [Chloroflexota bacterium]